MTFKELVQNKGLSPKEVASICGCSLATVYNWMGEITEPKRSQWNLIENYE